MKKRDTYLAIAITTSCNYQCFYCKEGGESISKKKETIPFSQIKKIIEIAYYIGIKNFRITGGEPTSVPYFRNLIEFIMNLEDTKIRINTNGSLSVLKFIDVLEKYKENVDIVISVDSISANLNGVYFPKFLSDTVIQITQILKKNGISVRYNIVVTSLNEVEVKELIIKAIDQLKVNVKLLDLNKFSDYLGYDGSKVTGKEAFDLWRECYVPMKNFYDFLEGISNISKTEWTTGFIRKGSGISMSSYFRGENWIQVKDSTRGAKYSNFCRNECRYFQEGSCQEGVFSLFLSSNLILHLSGCKNELLRFNLKECNKEQIKKAFANLLSFIE